MLSLSKYLLSHPELLQDGSPLLPGDSHYERFIKIFHKFIRENKDIFDELGVKAGDIGSHSTRKGAIALVDAGYTGSPPM